MQENYVFKITLEEKVMNCLSPSILSADFANLGEQVRILDEAGAQYVHIDVMDGMFVPSISFGMPVIKSIRECSDRIFDVHLMIVQPEKFLNEVKALGAYSMNVHVEACPHLHRVVQQIKETGMKAGVTLNPATPVSSLTDIIEDVDIVMLMAVNPGFGGQTFIPHTLDKVRELRRMIDGSRSKALIEVDGGVNRDTGWLLVEAGADVLVAGSAVFHAADAIEEIRVLKNL